ncbi:MAG: hypothetical protein GY953_56615, partial [bacterium]|nr:hypothetical protein [bacterium]
EVKHGFIDSRDHKVKWSNFDNKTEATTAISGASGFEVPRVSEGGYLAAEISAERADQSVTVYVRNSGGKLQVVGLDRTW